MTTTTQKLRTILRTAQARKCYWHLDGEAAQKVEDYLAAEFLTYADLGFQVTDRAVSGAIHLEKR